MGAMSRVEPIVYHDRYRNELVTEKVYGERWLRWVYETGNGQLALHTLVRRAFFSKFYGWRMSRRVTGNNVLPFVLDYGIPADESAKSILSFKTFNEFFCRALKPEARPIAPGEDVVVLPADGRHLAIPDVDAANGFYVKGQKFTLAELLGDSALAREFAGGAMLISRLCPVDYHRFHFPVAGQAGEARLINGWLYSVSPIALRRKVRYLVENKRMLTLIETPRVGRVAMLEIGATCVGTIRQLYPADHPVAKGDEKGLFRFGGSCVITLFPPGRLRLEADLVEHGASHREVYARMGDRLGVLTPG
jgi:phosphatidylserine decarboxylase